MLKNELDELLLLLIECRKHIMTQLDKLVKCKVRVISKFMFIINFSGQIRHESRIIPAIIKSNNKHVYVYLVMQ